MIPDSPTAQVAINPATTPGEVDRESPTSESDPLVINLDLVTFQPVYGSPFPVEAVVAKVEAQASDESAVAFHLF